MVSQACPREGIMMNYGLSDDTWGPEEYQAINDVIESRQFTMGQKVKAYEEKFALKVGSRHAVMVNSGSSANLIAIAALVLDGRLTKGDEVLVPAVSWSTTYSPLHQYGLTLKFIDVNIDTLNIDISEMERAISPNTKAVFAVNILGNPNDYDRISLLCEKYGLLLIEDNCEALGAIYNGKHTGTFGVIGTYSTFYSHHICTMEGGVTVTDDDDLFHLMLSIRAHGWTRDIPSESNIYQKGENKFYESFNFITPGYNLRPLEMEAAIGIHQLDKLNTFIENRQNNARYFKSKIDNPNILLQTEVGSSSWFGFSIVLTNNLRGAREKIVQSLQQAGIDVRPIVAGNFTRNSVIKYFDYSICGTLENADIIHENGMFVGNHSIIIDEKIDQLVKLLNNFYK